MNEQVERPPAHLEVIPAAPAQEPVIANLLQLYAHDFSEFFDLKLGADGRFCYDELPFYWREAGRHPFLVKVDGNLAGFVLVKRGSEVSGDKTVWDVAEFFVVRGYRRHGIGTSVAHTVWRQFPGQWEVRVMQKNDSARRFWDQAIRTFVGKVVQSASVEKNGKNCTPTSAKPSRICRAELHRPGAGRR